MKRMLVIFSILVMIGCASNQVKDEKGLRLSSDESAIHLIEVSGMKKQLDLFPAYFAELNSGGEIEDDFNKNIQQAFNPVKLMTETVQFFTANMSEEEIKESLVWLESPLGQKVVLWEIETMKPGYEAAKTAAGPTLKRNEARVEKIKQYFESINAREYTIDLSAHMLKAMFKAMSLADSETPMVSDKQINDMVKGTIDQLLGSLDEDMLIDGLYAYRDASLDELDQYIAFLKSDSGRRYMEASKAASLQTLINGSDRLGRLTAKDMGVDGTAARFDLMACIKLKTPAMCVTEKILTLKNIEIVVKDGLAGGKSNKYFVKAPTSNWKKVTEDISKNLQVLKDQDLVLVSTTGNGMIVGKYLSTPHEYLEAAALNELKAITDAIKVQPVQLEFNIWPYTKNGAVYETCYSTNVNSVECAYSAAANLPNGAIQFYAVVEREEGIVGEALQWMASIDLPPTELTASE